MSSYPTFFRMFTTSYDEDVSIDVWKPNATVEDFERDYRLAAVAAVPMAINRAKKTDPSYPVVTVRGYRDAVIGLLEETFGWAVMLPTVKINLCDSYISEEAWDAIGEYNQKIYDEEE